MNISVDEGLGLPVIVPVSSRRAAEGGAAEERKNQVHLSNSFREEKSGVLQFCLRNIPDVGSLLSYCADDQLKF